MEKKAKKRQREVRVAGGDDLDDFGFELADWQDGIDNEAEKGGQDDVQEQKQPEASKKRKVSTSLHVKPGISPESKDALQG